jgi:hypothetical protein
MQHLQIRAAMKGDSMRRLLAALLALLALALPAFGGAESTPAAF